MPLFSCARPRDNFNKHNHFSRLKIKISSQRVISLAARKVKFAQISPSGDFSGDLF